MDKHLKEHPFHFLANKTMQFMSSVETSNLLLCLIEHNILVVDIDRVHCFPVPVPSAPTITMAVSQSPTSITLSWTQPEGDVVDNYEVSFSFQRSCDGFNHTNTTTVGDTTRQYTLTALQQFSNYTVTMVAVNGAGRSAESSENVVTMGDGMSVLKHLMHNVKFRGSTKCFSYFIVPCH